MVEKRLLAVLIVACALGLAVLLEQFELHVHSVNLAFVRYQQNHHQKVFDWETTFVQEGLTF